MSIYKLTSFKYLLPLAFSALAFTIYSKGFGGPFVLDDIHNINPLLKYRLSLIDIQRAIESHTSGLHPWIRSLSVTSFIATIQIHGESSWGFKLDNTIIHLLVGGLIFLFTKKLGEIGKLNDQVQGYLFPLLATVIWLLHPLHVSTVLYSVQRIAQFSTLFTIAALCAYTYGRVSVGKSKSVLLFIIFPFMVMLGLLSKENTVLIFLFVLLTEALISRNKMFGRGNKDNIFLTIFCYLPLVAGIIVFINIGPKILDYSARDFTLQDRLLTQIYFVGLYLKQLLLPQLSKMGLHFDDIQNFSRLSYQLLAILIMHITLVIYGLWGTYKGKLYAYGILFFYIGHLLESTIIPLEMAFEHRNYLPSVGIFIAITSLLAKANISLGLKVFFSAIVIAILSTLLSLRVGFWANEHQWQQTNVSFHPKSVRARNSFLTYLNYYGKTKQFDSLLEQTKIDFPNEPILILGRLSWKCVIDTDRISGNNELDHVINIIKNKGFSVQDANVASTLTQTHTRNNCTNIDLRKLHELVNTMIDLEEKKTKRALLGHLYATKAMLVVKDGFYLEGHELLKSAFRMTGVTFYLFESINALTFESKYKDKALTELHKLRSGEYIDPVLFQNEIRKLESITSSLDYGNIP